MRARTLYATLIIAVSLLTGSCASKDDWAMWRSHNTHFASGEHGFFSMRNNKDGSDPKVYEGDGRRVLRTAGVLGSGGTVSADLTPAR